MFAEKLQELLRENPLVYRRILEKALCLSRKKNFLYMRSVICESTSIDVYIRDKKVVHIYIVTSQQREAGFG